MTGTTPRKEINMKIEIKFANGNSYYFSFVTDAVWSPITKRATVTFVDGSKSDFVNVEEIKLR